MKLVLVRHGETIENAQWIVQGHLPGHLSELGKEQANELALKLRNERFDQIWSSDLKRCVDTARCIMKFHSDLKLQLTPALREINFGELQGRQSSQIDWDLIEGTALTRKFPGGESNMEMIKRVFEFINQMLKKFPDQKIGLVTHGGPIRVIRSSMEKIPIETVFNRDIPNAGIFKYELKKPLKIYPAHPHNIQGYAY